MNHAILKLLLLVVGAQGSLLNFWSLQMTFLEKFEFLYIFEMLLGDNKKLRKF